MIKEKILEVIKNSKPQTKEDLAKVFNIKKKR